MGDPGYVDSLLEVGTFILDAGPAFAGQEPGDLLADQGPAIPLLNSLNSFINAPMPLGVFLLDHVLPQGGGADQLVHMQMVKGEGTIMDLGEHGPRGGAVWPGEVH